MFKRNKLLIQPLWHSGWFQVIFYCFIFCRLLYFHGRLSPATSIHMSALQFNKGERYEDGAPPRTSTPPQLRASAPPHLRVFAPSHRRTAALPPLHTYLRIAIPLHCRTIAQPHRRSATPHRTAPPSLSSSQVIFSLLRVVRLLEAIYSAMLIMQTIFFSFVVLGAASVTWLLAVLLTPIILISFFFSQAGCAQLHDTT